MSLYLSHNNSSSSCTRRRKRIKIRLMFSCSCAISRAGGGLVKAEGRTLLAQSGHTGRSEALSLAKAGTDRSEFLTMRYTLNHDLPHDVESINQKIQLKS